MAARERIAIVGAGLMGHGLAVVFANAGHDVAVHDPVEAALDSVKTRIEATLAAMAMDAAAIDRVATFSTLAAAVRDADIVIEAALEKLPLKQEIFVDIERHAPADALLASNTSVIPIGEIGARVASKHRLLGTHWWNPPYLVPLVEVIQAEGTAPETITRMMALLTRLGKTAVHVKRDVTGFVGNRLQHALWREAIALVADGVCDAETIDLVVKSSFGRRLAVLGPMEHADLVGTDLTLDIQGVVLQHLDRSVEPNPYLRQLVEDGKLGFKTGTGFKSWTEERKSALRATLHAHLETMNRLLDT